MSNELKNGRFFTLLIDAKRYGHGPFWHKQLDGTYKFCGDERDDETADTLTDGVQVLWQKVNITRELW